MTPRVPDVLNTFVEIEWLTISTDGQVQLEEYTLT